LNLARTYLEGKKPRKYATCCPHTGIQGIVVEVGQNVPRKVPKYITYY
jgi:hypothetical protein